MDFYCASCGRWHDLTVRVTRPNGRKVCRFCADRAEKNTALSKKPRADYAKRQYVTPETLDYWSKL